MNRINKKWLAVVLCGLWVLLVVVGAIVYVNNIGSKIEYSYDSDYAAAGESRTFISDNSAGSGAIYSIKSSGNVEKVIAVHYLKYIRGWRVEYIARQDYAESSDGLYALFVDPKSEEDGKTAFRVVRFSRNLHMEYVTAKYYVRGGAKISGLSISEDTIYVTEISEDRKDAYVYEISVDQCLDVNELSDRDKEIINGVPLELEEGGHEKAAAGRYFSEAEYAEGMLFSRFDGQAADQHFGSVDEIKKLFDNRNESLSQRFVVVGLSLYFVIIAIMCGCVIIIGLTYSFSSRRRMVYRLAMFEVLLFFLLGIGLGIVIFSTDDTFKKQFVRYEEYTLDSMSDDLSGIVGSSDTFDKSVYPGVVSELEELSDWHNSTVTSYDLCIVDPESGLIEASARGYSEEQIGFVYGREAEQAIRSNNYTKREMRVDIGGKKYILVINPDSGLPGKMLLAVATYQPMLYYIFEVRKDLVVIVLVIFLGVSLLGSSVIFQEGRDIRELGLALEQLAEGREDITKPSHISAWDMNRMWNTIQEIQRKLLSTRYSKYLIYEAYYRFAPKGVEKVLQKDSITEIGSGDTIYRHGTICYLTTGGRSDVEIKNGFLELLEKYRDQEDGVFVSSDTSISNIQLLFLERIRTSVRFGINLLSEYRSIPREKRLPRVSMILHYTGFTYGVVGAKDHVCPFLSSREMEALAPYAGWFSQRRVGIVITDSVLERERGSYECRYIGFILVDPKRHDTQLKLYEVLDADTATLRNLKKRLEDEFANALSLFYRKDFYLARNAFTEVARQNPEDEMARWYLFECERYLNSPADNTFVGEIHN